MTLRSGSDGSVPVFAFPPSLEFYTVDRSTHKLILTLYNPYDFTLKFKVYSTCPDKYNVIEPEGTIKSHNCIDIVVRHLAVNRQNENRVDKFRIKIYKTGDKKVIGKRDINARLSHIKRESSPHDDSDDRFQQLARDPNQQYSSDVRVRGSAAKTSGSEAKSSSDSASNKPTHAGVDRPRGPDLLIVCIAVICLTLLVMPCYGEESAWIPDHIRISQSHKLIAAFVLGMVTTVILKT